MKAGTRRLDPTAVADRRARPRTSGQDSATGLINGILRSPQSAAAQLSRDIQRGADPRVVLALLEAAADLARLRGLKIEPFVRAMRARLSPPPDTAPSAPPAGWHAALGARARRLGSWLRARLGAG